LASKGKKSLALEEKIEEHKAFLRHFQRLIGPEWLGHMGGVATIDRKLIMIESNAFDRRPYDSEVTHLGGEEEANMKPLNCPAYPGAHFLFCPWLRNSLTTCGSPLSLFLGHAGRATCAAR
jgi:hypothetical protein